MCLHLARVWFSGRLQLLLANFSDVEKPDSAKDNEQAESFELNGIPDKKPVELC